MLLTAPPTPFSRTDPPFHQQTTPCHDPNNLNNPNDGHDGNDGNDGNKGNNRHNSSNGLDHTTHPGSSYNLATGAKKWGSSP